MVSEAAEDKMQADRDLRIGSVLTKACYDPIDYSVTLTTGEEIRFTEAEYLGGDFILLKGITKGPQMNWERGISVNLSQIVYAVDVPGGT